MPRELTLEELYKELHLSPDLRRLGPYKLKANDGQPVLPIDIDFEGVDVYLGEGDFTEGLVAFSDTKVAVLDLGTCKFCDLYLDYLQAERLIFSQARASRVYFDYAKVGDCQFKDFTATEVYFDEATIAHISGESLRSGIVFLEHLQSPDFNPMDISGNAYRMVGADEPTSAPSEGRVDGPEGTEPEVRLVSTSEFMRCIQEGTDLLQLGAYKVVPEDDADEARLLRIGLELEGCTVALGHGDFTDLKVQIAASRAKVLDLNRSKFGSLDFADSVIEDCFLADSEVSELGFGNARIVNVFGERCKAGAINLASLECRQFNANGIHTPELRFAEARIQEFYMSRGDGVESIFFENAELGLLNLHEGEVNEVHFGAAVVGRALINKASIKELNIERLRANELYIGDFRNEIGKLRFSDGIEGIKTINISDAFMAAREVLRDIEGYASKWPREITTDMTEKIDETKPKQEGLELGQQVYAKEQDVWLEGPRHGKNA